MSIYDYECEKCGAVPSHETLAARRPACAKCGGYVFVQADKVNHPVQADKVNHPSHYTTGNIEVIDFIEDKQLGFHLGNVVKYVARAAHKGTELEDLKKARWYLDRKIGNLETKP
jgi:DNA-directed RNA polymerase subunit RPC12/RpoP